ncbi:MAG: nucleoside-diphosphate kinase [Candidatus Nealsonbacteria bacterium]|nr:MAG: nucleoside-diphosphate kinase [Candidatus Nealsonbacteria bacterium]
MYRSKEALLIIKSAGLRIVLKKKILLTEQQVRELYKRHVGKKFFQSMVNFLTSGDVIVFIVEGKDALNRLNELVGSTDPQEAPEGTIRHKFGKSVQKNAIHSSYSAPGAWREARIFFAKEDLARFCHKGW